MPGYKKVAVAGATGNLGPSIVEALINAQFDVTVLTRSGNTDGLPSGIKVVKVDYSSEESIINALTGQEAVVSNLPVHAEQIPFIDAAIKAGVKRFIPSEFGSNVSGNERTAQLPVFKNGKLPVQEHLRKKGGELSYTLVVTGFFLDWGLRVGMQINLKGDPTRIYDGGKSKHSMTLLSDIGKAVASILQHPEETHNRTVYIQSTAVSQQELIAIGRKVKPEWNPEIENIDSEHLLKDSYANLEKGGEHIRSAMLGFIFLSALVDGYGCDWADKNDNELLGVKELSREDLEKLVAEIA